MPSLLIARGFGDGIALIVLLCVLILKLTCIDGELILRDELLIIQGQRFLESVRGDPLYSAVNHTVVLLHQVQSFDMVEAFC